MELIIDAEFRDLLPPLTDDEKKQLEENILRDGIRDPLVIWKGHNILLDGHYRYNIARQHGLSFETVEQELPNRDAALIWIVQNQCVRKNLSVPDKRKLANGLKELKT